ncbi:hypothetical protein GCM10007913_07460 [Devosia yakushimensis]|uniref:Uncharacterized protein n=1 Tax=Devosia yakushimensis TaxID=470028 RepID=A0ABQ5UC56_9HYPH|nr:hypothetical protein GCM10007913_07460 [Devosia yakushimensis]
MFEGDGLGEIHHDFGTPAQAQQFAPQAAFVMFENNEVERRALPMVWRQDGNGTKHHRLSDGNEASRPGNTLARQVIVLKTLMIQ